MSPIPGATALSRLGWVAWFLANAPRQGRFPFRSPVAIERHQRRLIADTVRYAYRHVPYYRETMPRLGLAPGDIVTAADLSRLPLLERSMVQADPERFVSDAKPLETRLLARTAGSTATPLAVYNDPFDRVRREAFNQRASAVHRRVVGRPLGCRSLMIGLPGGESGGAGGAIAAARRLTRARTCVISITDPIERAAEEVQRFRPDIVVSHGSFVEALMVHLHAQGGERHRPRLVVYGGDAMSAAGRALIREEMGIPVLSVYAAHDAMTVGFECDQRPAFHLNIDICPTRVIGEDEREVPDGEPGSVIVSNLLSRGSIFLNYRLGDHSRKLTDPCPCGRNLPQLALVDMRVHDWLKAADGTPMRPAAVVKAIEMTEGVLGFQVRQQGLTDYAVDAVLRPGCDQRVVLDRLEAAVLAKLDPGTMVRVRAVRDLPRTPGAKVHSVVGMARSARHPHDLSPTEIVPDRPERARQDSNL
jgi:phenylacetate-CoA ligase